MLLLDENQKKVVQDANGYSLVQGTAGCGKSSTLAARVAYLISKGVAPESILAITFTNKAANELRERIESPGVLACTVHSLCYKILKTYHKEARLSSEFKVISESYKLLVKAIDNKYFDRDYYKNLHQEISKYKSSLKSEAEWVHRLRCMQFGYDFKSTLELYESKLAESNAIDFNDLIRKAAFLLKHNINVRRELSGQFKYILVDEAQDLTFPEFKIVNWLSSIHKNLVFVGDPAQSIYDFRCRTNIFQHFRNKYTNHQAFKLNVNYRCTQDIVRLSDKLMHRDSIASNQEDGVIRYQEFDNFQSESAFITNFIKYAHDTLEVPFNDIAVLGRTRRLVNSIAFELKRASTPTKLVKHEDELEEVEEVLPEDGVSCFTIHQSKGCQYEIVIVAGLEDDLLPTFQAQGSNKKLKEERRLLYVGITRARSILIMTSVKNRDCNKWHQKSASRFVTELGLGDSPQIVNALG